MRATGILRGDTDAPTTLSDLQHGATINLCAVAIQDELNELTADMLIAYEHDATGVLSAVAGTRSYSLASDFIRFFGTPSLYNSSDNLRIYEFTGGEQRLMELYPDYKTAQSTPQNFYFDLTTSKKVALWPVPQDNKNYSYDYEQDVTVTAASDTLPFHNEQEAQAFCRLATRRFKMLYEGMDPALISVDPEHRTAKATLVQMMRGKNPAKSYAPVYR
jgi:hypothetical protein